MSPHSLGGQTRKLETCVRTLVSTFFDPETVPYFLVL